MRFSLTCEIPWQPELVFRALRDEMPRVSLWLPRLDSVSGVKREDHGGIVTQTRAWRVRRDALPAIAQALTSRESIGWLDHTEWDAGRLEARWSNVPDDWPEAVTAQGLFRFEDDHDETVFTCEGELALHPAKLPRLPPGLAEKSLPALERFAFEAARPHFEELARAVGRFLEESG